MDKFSRLDFIKNQKPIKPLEDWRVWILLGPIVASVFGFVVSGVFSFAFDAIDIIPRHIQDWLVIVGSALTVFGAECNTPGTFIEVYRKIFKNEKANGWDYSAVALSAVGTIATLLIANAIRIMVSEQYNVAAEWVQFVIAWMPLVAALAVGFDYYGGLVETGSLFASYEKRIETWYSELEKEQRKAEKEKTKSAPKLDSVLSTVDKLQSTITDLLSTVDKLQKQNDGLQTEIGYLQFPRADLRWFKSKANGDFETLYKDMPPYDAVVAFCKDNGRKFEHAERTAIDWLVKVKH